MKIDKDITKLQKETTEALQPGTVVYIDTANKKYRADTSKGFFAITALEDTVLDGTNSKWNVAMRDATLGAGVLGLTLTNTSDITIPKGLTVYISAGTLVIKSGKCLAYARRSTRTEAEG
tara:strand:- start:1522 stop:1881 length:360 start_codon:yes stop_codon:yes gene_type:complete